MQWNIIQPCKRQKPSICNNMDEAGRHYAKCNKPDIERQILHDSTYTRTLKELTIIEAESKMMVARKWVVGDMGRC